MTFREWLHVKERVCNICGRKWVVSKKCKKSEKSYVCPRCSQKESRYE